MKRILARLQSGLTVEVLDVYEKSVYVMSLDGSSLDITYKGGIGYTGTPGRYVPREELVDAWIADDHDDQPMTPLAVYDRTAAILAGGADYQPDTYGRCTHVSD